MSTPTRVLGHYEVGQEIGAGGMGRVCIGTDIRDGSRVAIKFLQPLLAVADPSFRDRFEREAHVAALLRSPYTVHLLDYGLSEGTPCIVMEYVDGESVGALLARGPIPPKRAARIARDAARALEEARARSVVHRDIKPENILLTPEGMARVADFGIARQEAADGVTMPGGYVGTAAYSAPEQFLGEAEHRSDLFALGATLYAMLTGIAPFGPTGTRALAAGRVPSVDYSNIPEPLANVIRRCIERDPRDRYNSADDLAGALERVLAQLPDDGAAAPPPVPGMPVRAAAPPPTAVAAASATAIEPPRSTPPAPPARGAAGPSKGSNRTLLAVVVVLIVLVVGGGAAYALTSGGGSNKAAASVSPTTSASSTAANAGTVSSSAPAGATSASSSAPAGATAVTNAPTTAPTKAGPTKAPTVAPTPVPAASTFIVSGQWDNNFTVISATAACNDDPKVGKVLVYSYLYEEGGSVADGQIDDGEVVKVSPLGELVIGDYTFHWPQLNFEYDITGGHAVFSQHFLTPETATAALTETYDDGCTVVMRDDG